MSDFIPVKLVLEDGSEFHGKSFGFEKSVAGEVVFNTAMTGYPESLTDPSYAGQILVATYPLIGNYGIPGDHEENGLARHFESNRIHVKGLVISDYSFEFSHWNAQKSLSDWLKQHEIPGVFDLDTRAITKILREKGCMLGKIVLRDEDINFYDPNQENLVAGVSPTKVETYGDGEHKIVLVDTGAKYNIVRCLIERNATVIRVPWDYDFTNMDYDGVMLSNGPGNPQMCKITIANIQKALAKGKPLFGICLGNQLLGIAAGGNTYKLKYGHRSHNQPVLEKGTNRCYITSQNHGYALDPSSLGEDWEANFENVNDHTNEGIRHKTKPFFSTQFHPEASSGPTDTEFLFDEFLDKVKTYKEKVEA